MDTTKSDQPSGLGDRTNEARVIAITGANSGLGYAMAQEFLRLGHIVHGCGRRSDKVDQHNTTLTQAALEGQSNAALSSFTVVDVTDEASVKKWAEKICSNGQGPPSLLINNAGRSDVQMEAWEIPTASFEEVLQTNVLGIHNCIRSFVPHMNAAHKRATEASSNSALRGNGVIVNMSSGMGRSANPLTTAYTTSKWAVEGMTKCLALGLPDGMAAVALAPGVIKTENNHAPIAKPVDDWVFVTAPILLALDGSSNGKSITSPGFYVKEFIETWLIPDGCGLPSKVFGPPRRSPTSIGN